MAAQAAGMTRDDIRSATCTTSLAPHAIEANNRPSSLAHHAIEIESKRMASQKDISRHQDGQPAGGERLRGRQLQTCVTHESPIYVVDGQEERVSSTEVSQSD
ncbi:unnamed protein product [Polarella glacialis]|uniref:Uncharacterized protein n=1 Tax=Polarella glacialis TaxID=89957 RepID=A0A813LAE2_POLGL|nr:unnamed protein product [Polarella glacialis]